jgi:hypothetical protein
VKCAGKFAGGDGRFLDGSRNLHAWSERDALMTRYTFLAQQDARIAALGFRIGARGTHSSRTIMLDELGQLVTSVGLAGDVRKSILEDNALGKTTSSGRNLTYQRLKELYSFDAAVPLFRVFSRLAAADPAALPQLALLMALARDPLLRASARPVLGLAPGSQLMRDFLQQSIAAAVGDRLNEAVLDKVIRNTASSWTQTGHLIGRTIKRRARVRANQRALAFALWLADKAGFGGDELCDNGWTTALDLDAGSGRHLAERAHAAGLIDFRQLGSTFDLDVTPLQRAN